MSLGVSAAATAVMNTLGYVQRFSGQRILIKLGGSALQDDAVVEGLCRDLALMRAVGLQLVLVHGGGPAINEELTTHGITWSFVDGQRVTTPEMMEVVEMVLCGRVNRRIVRSLNRAGVRAVGLSGSDSSMLRCRPASQGLGRVGVIEEVETELVEMYLEAQGQHRPGHARGVIPVIAPVGVGEDGSAFNINADWAASRIAQALGIEKIIYLTDQDGILDSPSSEPKGGAERRLIPELDAGELEGLIERGVVQGGMLAKARTLLDALRHGVRDIHVLNGRRPGVLIEELFTDHGVGTVCRSRSRAAE